MNPEITDNVCVICRIALDSGADTPAEPSVTLTSRGLETLHEFSRLRNDDELDKYLSQNNNCVKTHVACRKKYTCRKSPEQQKIRE